MLIDAHTYNRLSTNESEKVPTIAFNLPEPDTPPKVEVLDICAALREASRSNKLLKLYLSEPESLTSCHNPTNPRIQQSRPSLTGDTMTLESIIQMAYESREISKKWGWNQRMLLAYRLASSLLQFHSTPWLCGSWKKQVICFSRTESSDRASLLFDADGPFITHDFHATPMPRTAIPSNAKASLLDLGILLLEIWHLTPFEAYAAEEGLHLDNTYGVRYEAAQKWLSDTADNILPFYADPVCRCIEGTFASKTPTLQWSDPQFQISICEGLIKPLWDNCSTKPR